MRQRRHWACRASDPGQVDQQIVAGLGALPLLLLWYLLLLLLRLLCLLRLLVLVLIQLLQDHVRSLPKKLREADHSWAAPASALLWR